MFFICVENFRVNDFSKDYVDHLFNSLDAHCAVSTDWGGCNYLRFTIEWNYREGCVDILMPEYVEKSLECLQHPKPKRPQYTLHRWTGPAYNRQLQMTPAPD